MFKRGSSRGMMSALLILTLFIITFAGYLSEEKPVSEITVTDVCAISEQKFLIACNVYQGRFCDVLLVEVDSARNVQHALLIGGPRSDFVHRCLVTRDGGVLLVGYTSSYGAGSYDFMLIKLKSDLTIEWALTIGGEGVDVAFDAAVCDDGILVVGSTTSFGVGGSDVLVVKLSNNGSLMWAETIGGRLFDDDGRAILRVADGFIIGGTTWSYGSGLSDFFLVKLDNSGKVRWAKALGGGKYDDVHRLIRFDDSIVIVGSTWSYGYGYDDAIIVKVTEGGDVEWATTVGGEAHDGFRGAIVLDNRLIAYGYTSSFGSGDDDMLLVMFDKNGELLSGYCLGESARDIACCSLRNRKDNGSWLLVGVTVAPKRGTYNIALVNLTYLTIKDTVTLRETSAAHFLAFQDSPGNWKYWIKHPELKVCKCSPYVLPCSPSICSIRNKLRVEKKEFSIAHDVLLKVSYPYRPIPWLRAIKAYLRENIHLVILLAPFILLLIILVIRIKVK